MDVYLLRHGIAENGKPGSPDSERALTADGRKKLREILKLAKLAGVSPTLILSSPYKRAAESAEIAAATLGFSGEPVFTKALTPTSTPEAAWDEIRIHGDAREILLVGHEPLFSQLTAHLLSSPELRVDFKKGALLRIAIEALGPKPKGVLRWMLTSRIASVSKT
jgi:phosphohistidine phosphatase